MLLEFPGKGEQLEEAIGKSQILLKSNTNNKYFSLCSVSKCPEIS
jgi:hypothetical protein